MGSEYRLFWRICHTVILIVFLGGDVLADEVILTNGEQVDRQDYRDPGWHTDFGD